MEWFASIRTVPRAAVEALVARLVAGGAVEMPRAEPWCCSDTENG